MSEILERLDDLWEKASDVDSLTVLDAREEIVKLRAEAKDAADDIEKLRAALQTARRDALEEAARVAEGKVYKELYRTWPWWLNRDGSQGNASNERDLVQHADKIAAAIRALSGTPPGTYVNEIEQERDEFFNRLGRITEELRLPMDATASRIIEAIRDRRREAMSKTYQSMWI